MFFFQSVLRKSFWFVSIMFAAWPLYILDECYSRYEWWYRSCKTRGLGHSTYSTSIKHEKAIQLTGAHRHLPVAITRRVSCVLGFVVCFGERLSDQAGYLIWLASKLSRRKDRSSCLPSCLIRIVRVQLAGSQQLSTCSVLASLRALLQKEGNWGVSEL